MKHKKKNKTRIIHNPKRPVIVNIHQLVGSISVTENSHKNLSNEIRNHLINAINLSNEQDGIDV